MNLHLGMKRGGVGGLSRSGDCQGRLLLQQLQRCKFGASLVQNVMVYVIISILGSVGSSVEQVK